MNTNSLNYEHCLRPTDTKFIVHKLSRNQHLNIVGTNPIHGTTRLLKDVKALETQLPDVTIVYINLRTYKDNFSGFLKVVANQLPIYNKEKITSLAELSVLFDKQAAQKQIWFLLDSLDVAFETINDEYDYTFLGELNVLKDTLNIRLICVTEKPLKSCKIFAPDKEVETTSPLQLKPPYPIKRLSEEIIEKELTEHDLLQRAYLVAIHRHDEPFRFMQFLIEKIKDDQFLKRELAVSTQVKACIDQYDEVYKTSFAEKWIHLGKNVGKAWMAYGGWRMQKIIDWFFDKINIFNKE